MMVLVNRLTPAIKVVVFLVCLIPLAVTSTRKMMSRLGSRWKRLHKLVYWIAALGVLHFLWLIKADLREPLLYAGILAVLLLVRLKPKLRN